MENAYLTVWASRQLMQMQHLHPCRYVITVCLFLFSKTKFKAHVHLTVFAIVPVIYKHSKDPCVFPEHSDTLCTWCSLTMGCLSPRWWNDMLSSTWANIDLVASGSWLRGLEGSSNGKAGRVWGGTTKHLAYPAGRDTPEADRGPRPARWLTPTLGHTCTKNAHGPFFFGPACLSISHTLRGLSRLVASVLSGHRLPRWIRSATLSVSGTHRRTHTGRCCVPPWQKGSMLSFQCDFLFPPASHLRSLGPVSFAPSPCQQPYGHHPTPLRQPQTLPRASCPQGASLTALNAPLSPRITAYTQHVEESFSYKRSVI